MIGAESFERRVSEVLTSEVQRVTVTHPVSGASGSSGFLHHFAVLLISLHGARTHSWESASGREEVTLRDREVLLVSPGTWLDTEYTQANFALSIRAQDEQTRFVGIRADPPPGGTLNRGRPDRVVVIPGGGRFTTLFRFVLDHGSSDDQDYLQAAATLLLSETRTALKLSLAAREPSKAVATWRMLLNWIDESIGTPALREDAAAALQVHPNHVSRLCRDRGTTYSKLVHRARIRLATELLTSTTLTASEVGYRCGYDDPPNFHHQFRKGMGMTPSQFRAVPRPASY